MIKKSVFYNLIILLYFVPGIIHAQYEWRLRACLPGPGRRNIGEFSVGNKGYVVGGWEDTQGVVVNEVWEYDPSTNVWTQKGNYPYAANGISAFVINDTAYVGLGYDQSSILYDNFYRYDAAGDQWIPIASFPGGPRYLTMSFVIGTNAYLGCGWGNGQNNDFYEYTPATNTWTTRASFPGVSREAGLGISVGDSGIMGMGYNGACLSDMYLYSPFTDSWTPISTYNNTGRNGPAFFSINDTVYAGAGTDGNISYSDWWRYDVPSNTWIQQENFSCIGAGRMAAMGGWSIYGHGYLPLGGVIGGSDFNNLLEFGPPDPDFITRVHVLGNDTAYCSNFSRVLSTGNACTEWSTGVTAAQITVTTAGTYWAYWASTCGMDGDTIHITNPTSATLLGNDTTYCGPFSRILSIGIDSTIWSTGETAPQITVTSPGTYWAYANTVCGITKDTIIINQLAAPQLAFGGDSFPCAGQTIVLNAAYPNTVYHWQDNSTAPTYDISTTGTYNVTATDTASGCSVSASVNIAYSTQVPQVNLGPDIKDCGNNGTTLNVPVSNANFVWSDGSTDSTLLVTTSGTYSVTVTNSCGSATGEVNITVYPNDCRILVPTAFSPNDDGVNDIFRAICYCPVTGFSMHVFNRWGEEVFSTNNIQNGWDGTYKNLNQPVAVYVYYIDYMNYCEGKTEQMKGNITLVR